MIGLGVPERRVGGSQALGSNAVSTTPDESFEEMIRSIEANTAHARQYLDRHAAHFPEHLDLPRATWRETGERLPIAGTDDPVCGVRAIEQIERGALYAPSLVLRNPEQCARSMNHSGPHASRVAQHPFRKSLWQALAWDDPPSISLAP